MGPFPYPILPLKHEKKSAKLAAAPMGKYLSRGEYQDILFKCFPRPDADTGPTVFVILEEINFTLYSVASGG